MPGPLVPMQHTLTQCHHVSAVLGMIHPHTLYQLCGGPVELLTIEEQGNKELQSAPLLKVELMKLTIDMEVYLIKILVFECTYILNYAPQFKSLLHENCDEAVYVCVCVWRVSVCLSPLGAGGGRRMQWM